MQYVDGYTWPYGRGDLPFPVARAVERIARDIAATAPVGRRGWKARAFRRACVAVGDRAVAWLRAEVVHRHAAADERARARARAELAERNARGEVALVWGPYGKSYFGSGGAFGYVRANNAVVARTGDDGFRTGPVAYVVIDRSAPASVIARGGDCIGDEGRVWGETYTWDPVSQTWDAPPLRTAW